ncbi:MAG TPA: hypothetical protein VFK06_02120 [Candidatus Angelobacter sp.]|nr:hypothetical protein [Candidatus Angelobacter sp.]
MSQALFFRHRADLARMNPPERIQTLLMEISRPNSTLGSPYRGVIFGSVTTARTIADLPD